MRHGTMGYPRGINSALRKGESICMKAVLLAGGLGTRISEETSVKPKPMIEVGGMPILWHIMKGYAVHGITDFIVCCGYKGHVIKEYFADYCLRNSSVTFDLRTGSVVHHCGAVEPWRVTCVDTGLNTMTGGRLKRVASFIGNETFCLTYGDGVSDIDIGALVGFHRKHGKQATLTAVQPSGRFGAFTLHEGGSGIASFKEKPKGDGAWVNGGFFVLEPEVLDYIEGDPISWEREPLERLSADGQLQAFRHTGFWQPMDTLRDKNLLEDLWRSGTAPWRTWEDESDPGHASNIRDFDTRIRLPRAQ